MLDVRLTRGRTLGLTASTRDARIFVDPKEPEASFAQPGEHWRAQVVEIVQPRLWRVKLLRPSTPEELRFGSEEFAEYREHAVALFSRYVGSGTSEIVKFALQTIDGLFTVSFLWEDYKGLFGQEEGLVFRVAGDVEHVVEPTLGGTYVVTPRCSGNRGIYCKVIAPAAPKIELSLEPPPLPARFEAHFTEQDEWGIYARVGAFKVRPDRNWPGELRLNDKANVWAVRVKRTEAWLAFVLPVGTRPAARRPRS